MWQAFALSLYLVSPWHDTNAWTTMKSFLRAITGLCVAEQGSSMGYARESVFRVNQATLYSGNLKDNSLEETLQLSAKVSTVYNAWTGPLLLLPFLERHMIKQALKARRLIQGRNQG